MDLQTQVFIISTVCATAAILFGIIGVNLYGEKQ